MYLNHGKRAKQPNKDNNRKYDIYKAGQVTRWCFKLGRFNESIISLASCENNKFYASHSGNYNYGKTSNDNGNNNYNINTRHDNNNSMKQQQQ